MNKRGLLARTAVGAFGGMLLVGVAGVAIADEIEDGNVEVNVQIAELPPVGALTMSVAQSSTTLTEGESGDAELRQFDGTLPTVTVSDDREEVPEGVFWYVTGQSSAFSADGVQEIGADKLGWVPRLLTEGNGEVAPGDEVVTVTRRADAGHGRVGEQRRSRRRGALGPEPGLG